MKEKDVKIRKYKNHPVENRKINTTWENEIGFEALQSMNPLFDQRF